MTLEQLATIITSLPDDAVLNYSLSTPFSWRGSYDEVAFSIQKEPTTKSELLNKIQEALNGEFYGWKGGEYKYGPYTYVHFEEEAGSWSDGAYTELWISRILDIEPADTPEERLINLLSNQ